MQIRQRVERLEGDIGAEASSVTVRFEGDDRPLPETGTVIVVRFVKPGAP